MAGLDAHPRVSNVSGARNSNMRILARPEQILFTLPDIAAGETQSKRPGRHQHLEERAPLDIGGKGFGAGVGIDQGQHVTRPGGVFTCSGNTAGNPVRFHINPAGGG